MIKPRVFWQIGDIARSSNILVSTVRKVLQAAVTKWDSYCATTPARPEPCYGGRRRSSDDHYFKHEEL